MLEVNFRDAPTKIFELIKELRIKNITVKLAHIKDLFFSVLAHAGHLLVTRYR